VWGSATHWLKTELKSFTQVWLLVEKSALRTPITELVKNAGQNRAVRNITAKLTRAGSLSKAGKSMEEAKERLRNAKGSYENFEEDLFDESKMRKFKKHKGSIIFEYLLIREWRGHAPPALYIRLGINNILLTTSTTRFQS
jgi:hypothetical protein